MLNIHGSKAGVDVSRYYRDEFAFGDSFTGSEPCVGTWQGKAAERLGLTGEVTHDQFCLLAENMHPGTGDPLTARSRVDRRPGYDFCFHVPKSVTLAFAIGGDRRIPNLVLDCARVTMREMEAHAATRVRKGGVNEERVTGNLAWAEFVHHSARPVEGVADPLLHIHCYAPNCTWDEVEQVWKAAEVERVKSMAPYFQSRYHARLQAGLEQLGYVIEMEDGSWEIQGSERATIEKYSRRSKVIERYSTAHGIEGPAERAKVAQKTRERKSGTVDRERVREEWESRAEEHERDWARQARHGQERHGGGPGRWLRPGARDVADAVRHGMGRIFERAAVVPEHRLIAEVRGLTKSVLDDDAIRAEVERQGGIRKELDGRLVVTTREALADEKRLVELVQAGRGQFRPLLENPSAPSWLNSDQRKLVEHMLTTTDQFSLVYGKAGTGKTTAVRQTVRAAVDEVKRSWHGSNRQVVALGVTTRARDVLVAEGFKDAETLAKFLRNPQMQAMAKNGIIWVDESALMGIKDAVRLAEVARSLKARVWPSGDPGQHRSVPRGNVFEVLSRHAGVGSIVLEDVVRQAGEWKAVAELLADHRTDEALAKLQTLGAVKEREPGSVIGAAVDEYLEARRAGVKVAMVAPTHAECASLTEDTRAKMRSAREIRGKERTFTQLVPVDSTVEDRRRKEFYKPGMIVEFVRNTGFRLPKGPRFGFWAGTRWEVLGEDLLGNVMAKRVEGPYDRRKPKEFWPQPIPLGKPEAFRVYEERKIKIAIGDRLRITSNGKTRTRWQTLWQKATNSLKKPTRALKNGLFSDVKGFTRAGDIILDSNLVVDKRYGHIAHGYAITTMAAQGMTNDKTVVCMTKASGRAATAHAFYVAGTRAKFGFSLFTDSVEALREAVRRTADTTTAMDVEKHGTAPNLDEWGRRRKSHDRGSDRSDRKRDDRGFER